MYGVQRLVGKSARKQLTERGIEEVEIVNSKIPRQIRTLGALIHTVETIAIFAVAYFVVDYVFSW